MSTYLKQPHYHFIINLEISLNLLQVVLSACVAAVKCRPILHHCVVIFFWSSGVMDCMLSTF